MTPAFKKGRKKTGGRKKGTPNKISSMRLFTIKEEQGRIRYPLTAEEAARIKGIVSQSFNSNGISDWVEFLVRGLVIIKVRSQRRAGTSTRDQTTSESPITVRNVKPNLRASPISTRNEVNCAASHLNA